MFNNCSLQLFLCSFNFKFGKMGFSGRNFCYHQKTIKVCFVISAWFNWTKENFAGNEANVMFEFGAKSSLEALASGKPHRPTKNHFVFKQICKTDIFLVAAAAALLNHSACWELLAEEFFWRPKLLAISLRIRENVADPELGVSGFGPDIDSLPPLLGPSRKKISLI